MLCLFPFCAPKKPPLSGCSFSHPSESPWTSLQCLSRCPAHPQYLSPASCASLGKPQAPTKGEMTGAQEAWMIASLPRSSLTPSHREDCAHGYCTLTFLTSSFSGRSVRRSFLTPPMPPSLLLCGLSLPLSLSWLSSPLMSLMVLGWRTLVSLAGVQAGPELPV